MSSRSSFSGKFRAILRIAGLMLTLGWHLSQLLLISWIRGEKESRGFHYRRKYTQAAMRILGVRLTMHGNQYQGPALYASNHRSLLDPIIQCHFIDGYIVSKSEVEKYPLIGRGARATGVVFVKRDSRKSRAATRDAIRQLLESGKSVLIYPEGTTSNHTATQTFKPGAFQIAAEAGVPVIPVTIQYRDPEDHWHDGPMLPFFMQKFAKKHIDAYLSIGSPLSTGDPESMIGETMEIIAKEIRYAQQHFDEKSG